uniref:Uncharacterized protein n=1 Tax=Nelumbo nucifera TaxID=4432 RepID=A0A822ZSL1_NELNU|nr:TPA_asm: hypothetical protein HUJ06_016488 [Nelumbo nucifera]
MFIGIIGHCISKKVRCKFFLLYLRNICFPPFRNSKLTSISTLANDLQEIFQLKHQSENQEPSPFAPKKMCEEKKDNNQSTRPMFNQDLNCLPLPVVSPELTENQQLNQAVPGWKLFSYSIFSFPLFIMDKKLISRQEMAWWMALLYTSS